MNTPIVIIPDIHGRTFWREAVDRYPNNPVIFLGDYLDPYPYEQISVPDALRNLMDIVDYRRQHPDKVTLLIGNHDIHYIDNSLHYSRKNMFCSIEAQAIFAMIGEGCFDMACAHQLGNRDYLFTHAGVLPEWWRQHFPTVPMQATSMATALNQRFSENMISFIREALDQISYYRGGDDAYSSCVWTDMNELALAKPVSGLYQVVGHSQQYTHPVIMEHFANLDCRRAFLLSPDGSFTPIV